MTHVKRGISTLAIAIASTGVVGHELSAQETSVSALSTAEIRSLVTERSNTLAERRSALSAFLEKSEVRRIARSSGIDIRGVATAAATLSDAEVERLQPSLRAADEALAGGATITLATTTIVIAALILVIVLLVS